MTGKKVSVRSKNQSGGQTAGTIINNINITNIVAKDSIELGNDDTQRLIIIFSDDYNAKEVAAMLSGAWFTLESPSSNLDYLAQAAHSVREFIEKAPKILENTPVEVKGDGLKNAVIGLSGKWSRATTNTKSVNTTDWSGEIDNPFKKALGALSDFFNAFDASWRPRSHLNRAVLVHLNGATQPIPEGAMKELLKRYQRLDDYFKLVAHHDIAPEDNDESRRKMHKELRDKIIELQKIMLDLKSPDRSMSAETLDALDAYILEGESA